MRKIGLAGAIVAVWLSGSMPAGAAEVAGVRIDDQVKAGATDLVLNGAGIRTKVIFKVYVGALYVTQKSQDASAIIQAREPRRIVLYMLRNLDADALFGALLDGLQKNHSEAELTAMKSEIDQFERVMRGVGNAKPGDTIAIDFSTAGVNVSFNGLPRGGSSSEAFAQSLMKIWLGGKPADTDLKRAMLGG